MGPVLASWPWLSSAALHISSMSPPTALPGMLHTHTGDHGWGGTDNVPCSFLRDPTCTLLPTAVRVPSTNQEAAPNFSRRQRQVAGLCFSLTAQKPTSGNCDGGHSALRTKMSLGELGRLDVVGGRDQKPTSRATAKEGGYTFVFRLSRSRGQVSSRPPLSHPSLVLSIPGNRQASGNHEKCSRTPI